MPAAVRAGTPMRIAAELEALEGDARKLRARLQIVGRRLHNRGEREEGDAVEDAGDDVAAAIDHIRTARHA